MPGAQTINNQSIILAGNLIIESTGSLTLNKSTLLLDRRTSGVYGIEARTGNTPRPLSSPSLCCQ